MFKIKKEKAKTFFAIASFLLSIVTLVAVSFAFTKDKSTTETVGNFAYERGNVDESGKVVESKKALVMKDARNVDGLTIDIDEENATITYRVVFYGEDGAYLSTTESMETDFDASMTPEGAETFRIIVTPYQVDGEDVEIGFLAMSKYAKQLDVTYNK